MAVNKQGLSKNVPSRIIRELIRQADTHPPLKLTPLRTLREAKRQAKQTIKHPLVAWVNAKSARKVQVFSLLRLKPEPNSRVFTISGEEYKDSGIYIKKEGYSTDKRGEVHEEPCTTFFLSSHGIARWYERRSEVLADDSNATLTKKLNKDINSLVQACVDLSGSDGEVHLIKTEAGQWILGSMHVDYGTNVVKGYRIATYMPHDMDIATVHQSEAFTEEQLAELKRIARSGK